MIRTSIIHASHCRPQMAAATFQEWVRAADHPEELEYILGLDADDPAAPEYNAAFMGVAEKDKLARFLLDVGDSHNVVECTNRIAKQTDPESELFLAVADDVYPVPHWDVVLFGLLSGIDNHVTPRAIWVGDGRLERDVLCSFLIMNRALYNKLGYAVHPAYTSMWADNDFQEVCKRLGVFIDAQDIIFQHRHFSTGLTPFDEVYANRNSQEEFLRGHHIYLRRERENFGL